MRIEEYWAATPREVAAFIRAGNERHLDAVEIAFWGAWRGEVFARTDRLPTKDEEVTFPRGKKAKPAAPGQQSGAEILAGLQASLRRDESSGYRRGERMAVQK